MRLIGLLATAPGSPRRPAAQARSAPARATPRAPQAWSRGPATANLFHGHTARTIVAAVDAVADQRRRSRGDRAFVLDGEVGNAAPRIEPIGLGERSRRADVEARAAGCRQWSSSGASGGRSSVVKIAPKKQPRSKFARHQVRMLALPADAGGTSERLLHHGRSVDEHFRVAAGRGDQPAGERLEPRLDDVVIIIALGIDRDTRRACARAGSRAGRCPARSSRPA